MTLEKLTAIAEIINYHPISICLTRAILLSINYYIAMFLMSKNRSNRFGFFIA